MTRALAITDVQRRQILRLYPHLPTPRLAQLYGLTKRQVYVLAHAAGLKKSPGYFEQFHGGRLNGLQGWRTRFKPGQVPANKGVKVPRERQSVTTQFATGYRPHTWRPVGSHVVNTRGYLDRKVNDDPGPRHVRWKPVHRLVWEEHFGAIPAGHAVAFKPGRATTVLEQITPDALELVTRGQLMARNTIHRYPPELKDAIRLKARLTRKTRELEKAQEHR